MKWLLALLGFSAVAATFVSGPPASVFSSAAPAAIVVSTISTNETSTAQQSHTIASATYDANTLYMIAAVIGDTSTDPNVTSISGTANLTWTKIGDKHFGPSSPTPLFVVSAWYTMTNAATTGTIVVNLSSTNHESTHILLFKATGTDTSGANGAGSLVQSNITAALDDSITIQTNTLPNAFGGSGNAAIAIFAGNHATAYSSDFESGWVEFHDEGINAPNAALAAGYRLLAADTSCTVTNTTSKDWAGIMWEIKKAP